MTDVVSGGAKKLFLHVGMEKTGSTAIQGCLQLNLAELPKIGFFIAGRECRASSVALQHRLAKACLGNPRIAGHIVPASAEEWGGWLAEFQASDCPAAILSSELFSYATAADIAGLAERLKAFEVVVVVYLRRQDSYVEAQYGQHLKGIYQLGGTPFDRNKFLPGNIDYEAFCGAWASVFGAKRLRVRIYDEDNAAHAIYRDFGEAVGLDVGRLTLPQKTVNPGLLEFQARVLLALRDAVADKDARAAIAQLVFIYNNKVGEDRPHSGRPKWLIPRERRAELLRMSAASNANVARIYLGRADGVLFAPKPEGDSEPAPIDYTEVARLLEYALATSAKKS